MQSEEGLTVLPEMTIADLKLEEYDSLLLPGAMEIRKAIEDDTILKFIKQFAGMPIGSISIAPLLLLKAGLLDRKPFMVGINPEDLAEEGYTSKDLALITDWDDSIKNPILEGYIRSGNIVTSVSYGFVR